MCPNICTDECFLLGFPCSSVGKESACNAGDLGSIPGSGRSTREGIGFSYFCFIDYSKAFDCVDHNKLWKILKEMELPDHLTCLLRNLHPGQEATVRTGHGTADWFQIRKGVHQGCILSPCVFNLYAEYIMRNVGLDEAQAGIKLAGRNINNLRYADDTTLMAESEEELKSLLMKVKVQFSRSVVSDSLRPHESQHARPPCPSPTPGVHSDSRPSSQ